MRMGNLRNHDSENREESGLLAWVEDELAFHEMALSALDMDVGDPGEEEYTEHNLDHLRLTQIKGALISGSILRYWSATPTAEVPKEIMRRDDWPAKNGVEARDHWAKVPVVI